MKKNINIKSIKVLNEMTEPTDDQIKAQEKFISLDAWDTIKCRNCGRVFSMLDCHSYNGDIICPHCSHLN